VRRIVATGIALALAGALLAGCGNSKSPDMLSPKGSEAHDIANVWWLMFGLAAAVYLVVGGLIIHSVRKGRLRSRAEGESDSVEPDTPRFDDRMVLWGGIVVPIIILFVIAVVTVTTTNALRRPASGALRVDVVGERWWWAVTYPSTKFVTANDIHLPAGRPVELHLTTADVIHSFWVPQLAGKLDMIPNQDNVLRFVAKTPGTYRGECAEFCGLQHAHMDFVVVVQSQGDFDRWMTAHESPPLEPASELADEGQTAFNSEPCAGCHTIDGTPAQGKVGPNLTDIGERPYLGAGALENTPDNLKEWITNAQTAKPGALMPPIRLSSAKARAIVAYLESLR
jgi:cytochrome c oxidase subunit 2